MLNKPLKKYVLVNLDGNTWPLGEDNPAILFNSKGKALKRAKKVYAETSKLWSVHEVRRK
jgi:hypothetical protein